MNRDYSLIVSGYHLPANWCPRAGYKHYHSKGISLQSLNNWGNSVLVHYSNPTFFILPGKP